MTLVSDSPMRHEEHTSFTIDTEYHVQNCQLDQVSQKSDEVAKIYISPLFDVQKTIYGGRGCFANEDILKGSEIIVANKPIGTSVVRPFRKEVCTWCFDYHNGKTLKHRIEGKVYFCSPECLQQFNDSDPDLILRNTLIAVEDLYIKCEGDLPEDDVPENSENLVEDVRKRWEEVQEWEQMFYQLKQSKRQKYYPSVTPEDYAEIKYVITTLYSLYRDQQKVVNTSEPISQAVSQDQEVRLFNLLQSSEEEKVNKYPYLLMSYINIYKFVRIVSPREFLPLISPLSIRGIIGRNLTNAFGIWSPITAEDEEREFFGFGVYASASYFNHSCDPNIEKVRLGRSYKFIASKDIALGEELCISYGIRNTDTVEQRRSCLSEWFFNCGCQRCVKELS